MHDKLALQMLESDRASPYPSSSLKMSQPQQQHQQQLHINLLPAEILHHIFSGLEPRDLGRLPRTCRFLHSYVKGNQKLCKDVYLNALVWNKPPVPQSSLSCVALGGNGLIRNRTHLRRLGWIGRGNCTIS